MTNMINQLYDGTTIRSVTVWNLFYMNNGSNTFHTAQECKRTFFLLPRFRFERTLSPIEIRMLFVKVLMSKCEQSERKKKYIFV